MAAAMVQIWSQMSIMLIGRQCPRSLNSLSRPIIQSVIKKSTGTGG